MSEFGTPAGARQEHLDGLGPRDLGPDGAAVAADLALLDAAEADLAAVQALLARMDEGLDGVCSQCGEPLTPEAIAADALVRSCPAH